MIGKAPPWWGPAGWPSPGNNQPGDPANGSSILGHSQIDGSYLAPTRCPLVLCAWLWVAEVYPGAHGDGRFYAWGDNNYGQLGTGDQSGRTNPTLVVGMTDLVAFSAGGAYSLGLKADGSLWAW
jgi:alpha-tubulin suppressor-like RCC1 family protein